MPPRIYDYDITPGQNQLFGPYTINDNVSSPTTLVTIGQISNANFNQLQYSINRGGIEQTGRLLIVTNGSAVSLTDDNASVPSSTGVSFFATISGSTIVLQYTSTSTGLTGAFKYYITSWS